MKQYKIIISNHNNSTEYRATFVVQAKDKALAKELAKAKITHEDLCPGSTK